MTYWIENDVGKRVEFASEGDFERALDWYNASSKRDIINYCESHGVSLCDPEDTTKLVPGWAFRAMQVRATNK